VKELNPTRHQGTVSGGPLFQSLHLLFDVAMLVLAWQVTLEVRLLLNPVMAIALSRERMHVVAQPLTGMLMLWVAVSLWMRLYHERHDTSSVAVLMRVAESAAVASTLAIVATFFSRHLGADLSRSFVLLFAPISFLHLVGSLYLAIAVSTWACNRWHNPRRVAVVGSGTEAQALASAICGASDGSIALCGFILPEGAAGGGLFMGMPTALPVLGTTRQLAEVINRECLDRIIVADESVPKHEFEYCGTVTKRMGIPVSRPIYPTQAGVRVQYQTEFGLHFVHLEAAEFSHWNAVVKRALDVVLSLALLVILAPLLIVLAVLVRATSRGPVFYRSLRVGKGGRYFTFWKFRSMYVNGPGRRDLAAQNERSGHIFKIRRDPRVTPVGRLMRRLSLDELPQLFNVLAGEMSLVGPRPLPAEDLDPDGMSNKFTHWAQERARVRPGITGLWQINGRSEVPFEQMMDFDLHYIEQWSLLTDLRILLSTPFAVLNGRGAY